MEKHLSCLSRITLDDLPRTGGKAAHLGELIRAGFPVPPGFCVCADLFWAFLEDNRLHAPIDEIAFTIDYSQLPDVEEKTAAIRKMMMDAIMPEPMAQVIRDAYLRLRIPQGSPLVAVRSSVGTRDSKRSSFPGQMDTFYNVRGADQVLHHVKKCWASVWTARAASVLHMTGVDHRDVIIAPVIQAMVQADASGVVFTANPENSSRDELLINAAHGLGEAVVGGQIIPDHYVVDKKSCRILSEMPGCKAFKVELDPNTGCGSRKVELRESEALAPCLAPGQVAQVAALATRIEEAFGEPQDVEWAFAGQDLYVLQTRRMAFAKPAPLHWDSEFDTPVASPPETYTSSNIGEVLPGVLTPLSMSLLKALDYGFWKANFDVGLVSAPFPEAENEHVFLGFYYGRAHLNLTRFGNMVARMPGLSLSEFDRSLPGDGQSNVQPSKWSLWTLPFVMKVLMKSLAMRLGVRQRLEQKIKAVLETIERQRKGGLEHASLEELMTLMEKNGQDGMDIMALHIANSQLAVFYYEMLTSLTRKWLGDAHGALASQLVTGLASLESAKPGFGIYGLYRFVEDSPFLKNLFLQTQAPLLLPALQQSPHGDAAAFVQRLEAFLGEYGYRSVFEGEVMVKSWEQDPAFLFSMIRNYLEAERVEDPGTIEARQIKERKEALARTHARLPWHKRKILDRVLGEAHTFISGREYNKAFVIKGMNEAKKIIRQMAARLAAKGLLEQEEDIFFLTLGEMRALCIGQLAEVPERIKRRRTEYERNQRVHLPVTFTGRPVPCQPAEPVIPVSGVLQGLSVGPGRVTGPARVILDPRKDAQIRTGEILVAPVTDASWTPLFLMAKAIVVDVGGLLSHGSVIAREFGIPGVLNVLKGTQVIRTGQIITVDGDQGKVHLHPDVKQSSE